jgi:integrase/recombinase XerD
LFIAADVSDHDGRRPRTHDLRHSFAVQALIRGYHNGVDLHSHLPRLAMFMGHVSIVSTAHYLHFVPSMRELASARFEAACGSVIAEITP